MYKYEEVALFPLESKAREIAERLEGRVNRVFKRHCFQGFKVTDKYGEPVTEEKLERMYG